MWFSPPLTPFLKGACGGSLHSTQPLLTPRRLFAPPTPPVPVTDQPFISPLSRDRWLPSLPSRLRVAWRLLLLSSHSRYKDTIKEEEADALICRCVKGAGEGPGRRTFATMCGFLFCLFFCHLKFPTAPHYLCLHFKTLLV